MMKRYLIVALMAVATILPMMAYTIEEIPNVHLQDHTRYVSNPDGVLSAEAQTRADSIIADIWRQSSAEVVAVVVRSIGNEEITDFAHRLATSWGVGKKDKDNGLLLMVVVDQRKATLRTGYGVEGLIPDIIASHIIRDNMAPHFREGDYDAGTIEALQTVNHILTTQGATEELMSKYANDEDTSGESVDFFGMYKIFIIIVSAAMLCWYIAVLFANRRCDDFERYQALDKLKMPMLFVTFLTLGCTLLIYLLIAWQMKRLRNKSRKCPNCNHKMRKLDEETDNQYLTPAQDAEERINAIDYDVWLCDNCGETDVLPYVNRMTSYTKCPYCGALACNMVSDRIVRSATTNHEGQGMKDYVCQNCRQRTSIPYIIPIIIAASTIGHGRGGGGFGGGGFSGGSFGGGSFGGGGATGSW